MAFVLNFHGHCQAPIPDANESLCLLSLADEVDTAVVLVHGFLGDAISTWEQFPYLIDACLGEFPWWASADAYFYGYKGTLHKPIAIHAEDFLRFLASIFPKPPEKLFQPSFAPNERLRPESFKYKKLILVGHSEGAVVIRRTLVADYKLVRESRPRIGSSFRDTATTIAQQREAQQEFLQANPRFGATLVLFAPAHLGASLTGWSGILVRFLEGVRSIGPLVASLTGYDELKKESPVLSQLKQDTEAFAKEAPYCSAFKAQSYFGERDRIVYIGEYVTDSKSVVLNHHGHTSICKPNLEYKEPLLYVSHAKK